MPAVAVPLALIFALLLLLAFYMAQQQTLLPLLEEIRDRLPRLARPVIPVGRMAEAIAAAYGRWIEPHIQTLVRWFDTLAAVARNFYGATAEFATALAADLDYFVTTRVPAMTSARLRALLEPIVAATVRLDQLPDWLADLRRDFRARAREIASAVAAPLAALLDQVIEVRIPALSNAIARVRAELRALVVDDVLPRLGTIEVELPSIRTGLQNLRRLLDDARAYLLPIGAVFTAAAVVELLRHVRQCRPKTERLCRLDTDDLDELLGLLVAFPAIAEMVAVMRGVAHGADELVDGLRLLR